MEHLLDMTVPQLADRLGEWGEPAFRAKQIAAWIYQRNVGDFAAMTDLSAGLRGRLAETFEVFTGKVIERRDSPDDVTKLLIEWPQGGRVETVLIPSSRRATVCLSTQVGCAMGCGFCASGANGLERNLTGGEIVEQVLLLQKARELRVTHVVFMGMGEPLANYEATLSAVRAIIDPARLGVSARHVTISTVGIPKAIRRLAKEDLPVTLAISLHAPTDALRRQLLPHAPSSISELIAAGREFFEARRRELTLEYVLLGGINDTAVCAEGLARVAEQLRCNVNLIRYNPVDGGNYRRPSQQTVQAFADRLERLGVNVQIRQSRGLDADAACGQLRQRMERQQDPPDRSQP